MELTENETELSKDFSAEALVNQMAARHLPSEEELVAAANEIRPSIWVRLFPVSSYKGFRPLSDQVLVRPLPASDRVSSRSLIKIPGNHDRGRLDNRLGVVLAIGPGDPVAERCGTCDGTGEIDGGIVGIDNCRRCNATGFTGRVLRTPFEVSVGDTVLFAPRGWAEIVVDGEALCVLHDCQHILAVVDSEAVLFTEDATTKKRAPDWD
jgi:co-chaperonin GroES (HSP10)